MSKKLERRINILSAYALLMTAAILTYIFISINSKDNKAEFDEIDVKRINLLAENGDLRMVLSNETRQHSGRLNGEDWEQRERPAGIIFFNTEGDECGGLIFDGQTVDGKTNSGMSFTMDQYNNDQVLQIINSDYVEGDKSSSLRGISIKDIPVGANLGVTMKKYKELQKIEDEEERNQKIEELFDKEGSKPRLFMGRTEDSSSGIFLADSAGNYKLKIYVSKTGEAKIISYDEEGEAINLLEK